MGNLCRKASSSRVERTDTMSANPINSPKHISAKSKSKGTAVVLRNNDSAELILGAEMTETDYDNNTPKGPGVILLPHQHTLFCERKQRVCTAVGKCQELEIVKAVGLDAGSTWQWIRTSSSSPATLSPANPSSYTLLEKQTNTIEYHLQKEDVGYFVGILITKSGDKARFGENLLGPVLPGPPRILEFHIKGDSTVGGYAYAEAKYIGGAEGLSQYWWMRITADGKRFQVTEPRALPAHTTTDKTLDPRYYQLTKEDSGCTLKAKIRPIRSDGTEGEIFTSKSSAKIS